MLRELSLKVSPREASNELLLKMQVSNALGVDINRIKRLEIIKRSIDARQRNIVVNLNLRIHLDEIDSTPANPFVGIKYTPVPSGCPQVIVVGAGPAGLFAALQLIERGIKPIVLERGKDVDSRRKDLARIARENTIDPDSNYCFGEGGAGTFSDGKLYTRSKKRGSIEKVLAILYNHGASENILSDSHPHIGTDVLPGVIKSIRETIIDNGGEIHFNSRVTGFIIDDIKCNAERKYEIRGVITADGKQYNGPVILATGHSARDTYSLLHESGISLEPKGLAIGVRLEHPQHLIDCLQYHTKEGRGKYLLAAEYSFLTRVDDRGVYSFCMCPGGVIVPSASAPGESVVNGMSSSSRGSKWANSAMVVEILPEDVKGDSPLKMLEYQRGIEADFFRAADGTQKAPAQRMTDFVESCMSDSLEDSSYAPGVFPARVDKLLPKPIASRLQKAFKEFDKRKKGFLTPHATVVGAETRTSSPIRIPRDKDDMQHVDVKGLYPVGEGAGWAGGIVSSAMDGMKGAEALANNFHVSENGAE